MTVSTGNDRKPRRVHVLFDSEDALTPNGSSYIRLLRPLSHPTIADRLVLSYAAEMTDANVDLVIVDRFWHADLTPARQSRLLTTLARRNIPYIYSIDDNLLDLKLEPGSRHSPSPVQRNLIREFIRSAAGVIASTDPLAERIAALNPNIAVVQNQLDETLYPEAVTAPRADRQVVVGCMGTYSHFEDLMMIAHPVRQVLARHPGRIRLELVGIAERSELLALFPGAEVEVLKVPGSSVRYPEFVAWMQRFLRWDVALAPLRINVFNRSKSDIKWLDYGMLGIPGIFSAAPAYERSVEHEVTGLLAENSSAGWAAALDRVAGSRDLREKISAAVRHQVWSSRTLAAHAPDWTDAIESILVAAAADPALPAPHWAD